MAKRTVVRANVPMVASLGQLRERQCWVWLHCSRSSCLHYVPVALAPLIILFGEGASSDRLRHSARCSKCGSKGVTIQLPKGCLAAICACTPLSTFQRDAAPRVREQISRQRALAMWVPESQVSMQDFISEPRAPSRRADPPEVDDGCCVADRSDGLLAWVWVLGDGSGKLPRLVARVPDEPVCGVLPSPFDVALPGAAD